MSAAAAPLHEPFTMYPNYYLDYVKPRLSGTQRDVCDLVIRMTRGWHRESASIPNSMFVDRTGRSARGLITARSQLINMGLLVVVREGGGKYTSEYRLNLYYNARPDHVTTPECDTLDILTLTPEDTVDSSITRDDSDVLELDSDIVSDSEVPTPEPISHDTNAPPCIRPDAPITSPVIQDEVPVTSVTSNVPATSLGIQGAPVTSISSDVHTTPSIVQCEPLVTNDTNDVHTTSPVVLCEGPVTSVSSNVPVTSPVIHGEPPVTEVPTSDSILDARPHQTPSSPPIPTPALIAPPRLYNDLGVININKTETEETDPGSHTTPDGRKQRTAAHVRYRFSNLFPGVVDSNDWPLFGWAVKSYGVDMCLDKLSILAEYRRERPITNPKGLFRMALLNDYQLPGRTVARIRAEEAARRAMEDSQRRSDEWSSMAANYDYDGAAVALQKLMDTLE